MSLRYLLETSIVSAPVSKKPSSEILKRLERDGNDCAIAAPVWNELVYGCDRLPSGKRRTALVSYLNDVVLAAFPVLAYDEAAARWHGVERARLEKQGKPAPYVDGQIAAIAYVNDLTVATVNVKDFERFKGLHVQNWAEPAR